MKPHPQTDALVWFVWYLIHVTCDTVHVTCRDTRHLEHEARGEDVERHGGHLGDVLLADGLGHARHDHELVRHVVHLRGAETLTGAGAGAGWRLQLTWYTRNLRSLSSRAS